MKTRHVHPKPKNKSRPEKKAVDQQRLEALVNEFVETGALTAILKTSGGLRIKGIAFLLQDLRLLDVKPFLGKVDLSIPVSSQSIDTLKALKNIVAENATLKELSVTDNLTGLYNSRYFRERLDVEMERVRRNEKPCSLIMIDLDNFKPVNDRHGHQTGDELLIRVARILKNSIRAVDVPVRYGGDEMAVILPDTGTGAAYKLAERIRHQLETDPGTAEYGVTGSFGVATNRYGDMEEATNLVERADRALYGAKGEGGNRVRFSEVDRLKEEPTEVSVDERNSLFAALQGRH